MTSRVLAESRAALERLIRIARGNTGQSRILADFQLAWWNATECGGFDLTDVWPVDTALAIDMLQVLALVIGCQRYPDATGYSRHFDAIVRVWRPALAHRADGNPS